MSVTFERRLPYRKDLQLSKGSMKILHITVAQADGVTPFDLTGWSIRSSARTDLYATVQTGWFTFAVPAPATAGLIVATLSAVASGLLASSGVYDVEIYRADDPTRVIRVVEGRWAQSPEVT